MNKHLPKHLKFIIYSLILLLFINLVFRSILFFTNIELSDTATYSDVLYSFFNRGLLFDLYISLIILVIPFLVTSVAFVANKEWNIAYKISSYFITILGIITIMISASDLGFFKYYNTRITNAIFDWADDIPLMIKLSFNDYTYVPYLIAAILFSILFIYLQNKVLQITLKSKKINIKTSLRPIIFIVSAALVFLGIRGTYRFDHRPLNFDDAYFSEVPFLNQLGFNGTYALIDSYRTTKIDYYKSDQEAINKALDYLKRAKSNQDNPFTIIHNGSDSIKPNVVVIFVESLSSAMVSRYHSEYKTTLFIDSLAEQGIVFDNFYSAGIHTYNGIFSSLYGLPAVLHNKPLKSYETANMKFNGLPNILKKKGYTNYFYVTGKKSFDNMNAFLLPNGFDRVIGESDYPSSAIDSYWGVSDKTMFNRILNECDSLYNIDETFYMNALTISTHEANKVPSWCKHQFYHTEYPQKLYEFMDLQLREFFEKAKSKEWFDNTVFVIFGDHGQNFSATYDLNLNYHKVPFIIYAPKLIKHKTHKKLGVQSDIYPTVCGLLDFTYRNNGLGIDLTKENREYAYFSADTKIGVINDEYYLIYRNDNNISLYEYKKNNTDIIQNNKAIVDSMCNYTFSMLQSCQYIIRKQLAE